MPTVPRIFAALCILGVTTAAHAGEGSIHPSIAVSEEFNDNVLVITPVRVSDYITRVLPGVVANYDSPLFKGDLNYTFDYRYYAKNSIEHDYTHNLQANGHLTAVENLLFLDVTDQYQRVSLDVARDMTQTSLFFNQADQNIITVAPYVTLHPGQRTTMTAGYQYSATRYFDVIGQPYGINQTNHVGYLNASYELSQRWTLKAGYSFTRELSDFGNLSQHQGFGGFRYEYADKSFLFAEGGNTWTFFDAGNRLNNAYWNAGLTHTFDTIIATVSTGVRYDQDPLGNIVKDTFASGDVEKHLKNGSLKLSLAYHDYVMAAPNLLQTNAFPTQISAFSVQTKAYSATLSGSYDFTSYLSGNLAFSPAKYEEPLLHSYTWQFMVDAGLSYLLAKDLTLTLSYNYMEFYSPDMLALDNTHVNRVSIGIKKVF